MRRHYRPTHPGMTQKLATPYAMALKPFAFAAHLAVLSSLFVLGSASQVSHAQTVRQVGQTRDYAIPSGPLSAVLTRFSAEAGVYMIGNSQHAAGKNSQGLSGSHSVDSGFAAILAGTGLQAVRQPDGMYGLMPAASKEGSLTTLPAVTVHSGNDINPMTEGSGSYVAHAASIGKINQKLKDIPQSVTVITRQQMDDQQLDTVTKVLGQTPGITLVKRANGGNDIYSRGFLTETLQYDGLPLSRFHSWGNSLSASAIHLDRIEVLRGAQGLLEGTGSPAGAVNLVRKRGLAENALTVEGRVGSWSTYGTRIDAGGPLNKEGTLRARAALDYENKKSFIDTVWDRNINAYAALDLDVTADTTIGLGVAYARLKGNSALYPGVPRYDNGHAPYLPRSIYLAADWNAVDRRETQVFLDLEHRINADWRLKVTSAHINEQFDAITAHANGVVSSGNNTVSVPGYDYDLGGKTKGIDVNLQGKFSTLGIEHDMVVGANYSHMRRDDGYLQFWNYTSLDVFDPNHHLPRFDTLTPTSHVTQLATISQHGIYGMLRSHVTDRTTLMLGGRTSWYKYNTHYTDLLSGDSDKEKMQESGKFTPYAGIVYALSPQWSTYASYAQIFEPQTASDAQLKALAPMTGTNIEIGIKGELFNGMLNTSLALYRVEQNNRGVTDYDSPQICGGYYCSRATGKVRSEGFEAQIQGALTAAWQISGGYTYNRNKYLQDTDASLVGKPFDYLQPKHMLRVWSDYQLPGSLNQWRIGAGVNYRSAQHTDSTTKLNPVQGAYAIWNARVAYQIDPRWSLSLNIDNLFDKHYYSFISKIYYNSYIGEPRRTLLTLTGKF